MEIDYKAIGLRIRNARIRKNTTQEKIAELINITPAHMSNIETGKTKVSLPTLVKLANALSVSIDVLLCDNIRSSKNVLDGEIKDVLNDCTEYELRFLTDLLKTAKLAMRRNQKIWN